MLALLLLAACQSADPPRNVEDPVDAGPDIELRAIPDVMETAIVGEYSFELTAGEGLPRGTELRFEFPVIWRTNPHPLRRLWQPDDPSAPHFFEVTSSDPAMRTDYLSTRVELSGQLHRYPHIIEVELRRSLPPGASLTLTFSNTTSPYLAGPDAVQLHIDPPRGDLMATSAEYEVLPGPLDHWQLTGSSDSWVGNPTELQLVAMDAFHNLTPAADGSQLLATGDGEPLTIDIINGIGRTIWTPTVPGDYRLTAAFSADLGHVLRVHDDAPQNRLYWGDLHAHSKLSKDGLGEGDFIWARDVADLDFYASTEHSETHDNLFLYDAAVESVRERVRDFYEPGSFATLFAFEVGLGTGHHNIYYRGLEGGPVTAGSIGHDVSVLWQQLERGEALTVPHTTGISFRGDILPTDEPELQVVPLGHDGSSRWGPHIDWALPQDDELRPAIEIYSEHGQSEYWDVADPLAYEQIAFTNAQSQEGPHYAIDAWEHGHHLRVIAASDNHDARPGMQHKGLTAVWAPELTREAIFDAVLAGHTYGTTGERVVLDFRINGEPMGSRIIASQVDATVEVHAPRAIAFAEVWAWDGDDWRQAAYWSNPGPDLNETFTEGLPAELYYLRVELQSETNGRLSRAWSSPIWVE